MHQSRQKNSPLATEQAQAKSAELSGFGLDTHIPYLLVRTSNKVGSSGFKVYMEIIRRYAPLNLREFRVLVLLPDCPLLSPKDAADLTGMDRATVTRAITGLQRYDLIGSVKNAGDARSKHIYLTDQGQQLCDKLIPVMLEFGEYVTRNISAEEVKILTKLLENIETQTQQWFDSFASEPK